MDKSPHNALVYEYRGRRLTLAEIAAESGVSRRLLYDRIATKGWTVERAATRPKRKQARPGGRLALNVPRPCPAFKRHPSGRAYSRWKMHGKQHERYFGAHGTPEAATNYRKFAIDWAAGRYEPEATAAGTGGASVGALIAGWLTHCRQTYVKDGVETSEVAACEASGRALNEMYGATLAANFTPANLRALRDTLVERGLCRTTCNRYASRVVRCFAWGASHSMFAAAVHAALALVEQLAPGRTVAPDYERKKPATDAQVEATVRCLAPSDPQMRAKLAAMIAVQRLAGMRPGEVCAMRAGEVDRTGDVWRYTVGAANKNRHRGKKQVYYLGPKAVAALRPYLEGVAPADRVFAVGRMAYASAIAQAAVRAKVEPWAPHQLRHALATEVAARFRTLEHAAAAIGDSEAVAAAVYVHVDPRERAKIEVARLMG